MAACHYRGSYHLIFPWANGGNLRQLWRENPNPALTWETIDWATEQFIGLASCSSAFHGVCRATDKRRIPRSPSNATNAVDSHLFGRHGDIKPANILHFSTPEFSRTSEGRFGRLVLCGFGLSRRRGNSTAQWPRCDGFTVEYYAPEAFHAPALDWNFEATSAYDVWGLGCVFLEFLTRLLRGWAGLEAFKEDRQADRADTCTVIKGY